MLVCVIHFHGVPVVSRHVKWVMPSLLNTHANNNISKFKMTNLRQTYKLIKFKFRTIKKEKNKGKNKTKQKREDHFNVSFTNTTCTGVFS